MLLDCGIDLDSERHREALAAYLRFWDPHTDADPDAVPLMLALRERGIRIGVLSNTLWPRAHHEVVFARDGLLELIDGAVDSSVLPVGKPHEDAFIAACARSGWRTRLSGVRGRSGVGRRGWRTAGGDACDPRPHSDIPDYQRGPVEGEPNAVVQRLGDVLGHVDRWNGRAVS